MHSSLIRIRNVKGQIRAWWFKNGLREPGVRVKSNLSSESFVRKFSTVLFAYNLMIGGFKKERRKLSGKGFSIKD